MAAPPQAGSIQFRHAVDCGVDFEYYGNPSSRHDMTEQNGGGVCVLDYDRNGRPDLFFTNGDHFEKPAIQAGQYHALFRNEPSESLKFTRTATAARLVRAGFGMGTTAADFDNDGFADLLICYYGHIELWQNQGDGTFREITKQADLRSQSWSTSAAFGDVDGDGDLDLYIANYVVYSPTDPPCYLGSTPRIQISCGPQGRQAQADQLWENLGDGTFRDVSGPSGIHSVPAGKGLAVELVDLDGDDQLDIYVSNDTTDNFLFRNLGGLKFVEEAALRGVALGTDGTPESSMGIACADFDGDQRFDLFVTNFESAIKDFYLNLSADGFLHASKSYGLDLPSRPMLNFGTIAGDFDRDGWPDLFVANGHIWDLSAAQDAHEYQMTPQLFRNQAGQRFDDVSSTSGDYFRHKWLGRSASSGDFDNDGDLDLVIAHQLKPAAVLENQSPAAGQPVLIELIGTTAAREPLGMRVVVEVEEKERHYHLPAGGSYQAGLDPRLVIATGNTAETIALRITWQPGQVQRIDDMPAHGRWQVIQGQPRPRLLPEL